MNSIEPSSNHRRLRWLIADLKLDLAIRRFARKYSPDQPRDDQGRWTDGSDGARVQDENATDEQIVLAASRGGGIPSKLWNLTVRQFVSRYCEGRINRELPGQFDNVTLSELLELRKGGDAAAEKCYKLLNQSRFRKDR